MDDTTMPAETPELRSAFHATLSNVECRQAGNGEDFTLTGHAAVFDKWSEELHTWAGTFREKIAPGAFTGALKQKPDVRLLFNHDGMTLARTKAGTLELSEDDDGLKVWARLAPTQTAKDLRMAMQRGDIDQMSFAFTVGEDEWREDHDTDEVERTITRVDRLFDVSVVSFPAYPDTDAAIRELRSASEAGKITAAEPSHGLARTRNVWITDDFSTASSTAASSFVGGADLVRIVQDNFAALPETDAAGDATDGDTEGRAQPETDVVVPEVDPLAALRASVTEAAQRERESYLRLLKDLSR